MSALRVRFYRMGSVFLAVYEQADGTMRYVKGRFGDFSFRVRSGMPAFGGQRVGLMKLSKAAFHATDGFFSPNEWGDQLLKCLRMGTDHTWIREKPKRAKLNPLPVGPLKPDTGAIDPTGITFSTASLPARRIGPP